MPHRMKDVYADVFRHPFMQDKQMESCKYALGMAAGGYSWCTRQNNKWARAFWKWMYAGGPRPSGCLELPELCPRSDVAETGLEYLLE